MEALLYFSFSPSPESLLPCNISWKTEQPLLLSLEKKYQDLLIPKAHMQGILCLSGLFRVTFLGGSSGTWIPHEIKMSWRHFSFLFCCLSLDCTYGLQRMWAWRGRWQKKANFHIENCHNYDIQWKDLGMCVCSWGFFLTPLCGLRLFYSLASC